MPPETATSQRIRSLRPSKPIHDPWRPIDVAIERELQPNGDLAQALTIFLTGRECPFTCVFCDLWRFTTDLPTPLGAIPAQIESALASFSGELEPAAHIKLYNASNYFDPNAVPPDDDRQILRRVEPFAKVIVECHPRLVGSHRCQMFAESLGGSLQVAMGLETIHPEALPRLNKQSTLDDFRSAAAWLAEHDVGLRAFVLVGAPFIPLEETAMWAERSTRFAFEQGAEHVALIPVRSGNGEMERLEQAGHFSSPSLRHVEEAFELCLNIDEVGENAAARVVTVDTWDLEVFATCSACTADRINRLERINLSGLSEPLVTCAACSGRG